MFFADCVYYSVGTQSLRMYLSDYCIAMFRLLRVHCTQFSMLKILSIYIIKKSIHFADHTQVYNQIIPIYQSLLLTKSKSCHKTNCPGDGPLCKTCICQ